MSTKSPESCLRCELKLTFVESYHSGKIWVHRNLCCFCTGLMEGLPHHVLIENLRLGNKHYSRVVNDAIQSVKMKDPGSLITFSLRPMEAVIYPSDYSENTEYYTSIMMAHIPYGFNTAKRLIRLPWDWTISDQIATAKDRAGLPIRV